MLMDYAHGGLQLLQVASCFDLTQDCKFVLSWCVLV
jgi:hypothetical protein